MITQKEIVEDSTKEMAPTKIEGFFAQFPWVKKWITRVQTRRGTPITRVFVSRLEPALLREQAYEDFYNNGSRYSEKRMFFDESGNVEEWTEDVCLAIKKYVLFGPKTDRGVSWPRKHKKISIYRTIWEEIETMDWVSRSKVRFIVSYLEYYGSVILYKLPKGQSLNDWIDNEIKSEQEVICAALEKIDER